MFSFLIEMYDKRTLTRSVWYLFRAYLAISVKSKTVAPGCLEKACSAMRDVIGSDGNAYECEFGEDENSMIKENSCGSDRALFSSDRVSIQDPSCTSSFRAFQHRFFLARSPACAFRFGSPSGYRLGFIVNWIGTGKSSGIPCDPGVCDRPTERRVENAFRTRKRTSQRHDKRNGSRLQLLPPLPSSSLPSTPPHSRGRALREMDARG